MIVVNTKNYKTGSSLLKLAKQIESYDIHTVIAVPVADINAVASKTSLSIYAQHVDVTDEKSTGFTSITSIKANGASGVILNHAEHPLSFDILTKTIQACKKAGLITLVCAKNRNEVQRIARLKPSIIALEDPALIGTKNSITNNPRALKAFVADLKGKPTLAFCGAGINSIEDVRAAHELGCTGVLIASAIAASPRPDTFLKQLSQWQAQR